MFAKFIKFLESFTKLPKPVQEQIITAIIATFTFVFRYFFNRKKEADFKKTTDEVVTPQQWQSTSVADRKLMPTIYTQKKKEEFANSVVELIRSRDFIKELGKRIEKVNADDEETYVALCSIETKKLIIEMMHKK